VLLRSPAEGPVLLLLRPEQISITDSPHPAGTLARVNRVDYYGHDATVALTVLPDGPAVLARTTARSLPEHGATVGLTVTGTAQHFPTPDTPA